MFNGRFTLKNCTASGHPVWIINVDSRVSSCHFSANNETDEYCPLETNIQHIPLTVKLNLKYLVANTEIYTGTAFTQDYN